MHLKVRLPLTGSKCSTNWAATSSPAGCSAMPRRLFALRWARILFTLRYAWNPFLWKKTSQLCSTISAALNLNFMSNLHEQLPSAGWWGCAKREEFYWEIMKLLIKNIKDVKTKEIWTWFCDKDLSSVNLFSKTHDCSKLMNLLSKTDAFIKMISLLIKHLFSQKEMC